MRSEMPPRKAPMPKGQKPLKRSPWRRVQSNHSPEGALGALRGSQAPSRRDSGPDQKTRRLVKERDGWCCVLCGIDVHGVVHNLQHRRARGVGGSDWEFINSPANLLLLCGTPLTFCHGRVESKRREAQANGWAIPLAAADPAHWPVWTADRGRILLDHDGGWRPA